MSDEIISEDLLELLACPICRTSVHLEEGRLACRDCGRRYPVRDGIPVMLVDEADPPEGAESADESEETEED